MNLLCLDVSSSGISAAVFDSELTAVRFAEAPWNPQAAVLLTIPVQQIAGCFKQILRQMQPRKAGPIDAICISSFLHNFVLLDDADQPLTSVLTGLDRRGDAGVEFVRNHLHNRFEELTGCRYHAMFPAFKVAMLRISDPQMFARARRVISIKALLVNWLTGSWAEDFGSASASGLANLNSGDWEPEVMAAVGLERSLLPSIVGPTQVVGDVTSAGAAQFGLTVGTKVVAGLGSHFAASLGSGCEASSKVAATLGASAVAHQIVMHYVEGDSTGTFCYRADENKFILGSASINGGSVLDWGRQVLGDANPADASEDPPIFIPLLHGERSAGRDPRSSGGWYNLSANHTAADLSRSILEGVLFDLAHSIETVQKASGEAATDLVLSGSGFTSSLAVSILATIAGRATWILQEPGLATLRGAGICALRALGRPTLPPLSEQVSALRDLRIAQRYSQYLRLKAAGSR